jgi:hypothetical protein
MREGGGSVKTGEGVGSVKTEMGEKGRAREGSEPAVAHASQQALPAGLERRGLGRARVGGKYLHVNQTARRRPRMKFSMMIAAPSRPLPTPVLSPMKKPARAPSGRNFSCLCNA